jgi:hypothetical protein
MWKYIISISLLGGYLSSGLAQEIKIDSGKVSFRPTGIRIGTDAILLAKTMGGLPLTGWEITSDVDFKRRYYLAVEYGHWQRKEELETGQYNNKGNYFRAGIDVNFLLKDPDRNMFFLGFRIGQSRFEEELTSSFSYLDFTDFTLNQSNRLQTATWGELTTGLRVRMFSHFWMGYTGRLKFAPSVKGQQRFDTYDIPGYGRGDKSTYWGFNYQLFWRIPIRKNE